MLLRTRWVGGMAAGEEKSDDDFAMGEGNNIEKAKRVKTKIATLQSLNK